MTASYINIPEVAIRPNGDLRVPHHLGPQYVRDYNRGWRAPVGADAFSSGRGSDAYDDGYLDRASREDQKWHLAWCTMHGNGEGFCGVA